MAENLGNDIIREDLICVELEGDVWSFKSSKELKDIGEIRNKFGLYYQERMTVGHMCRTQERISRRILLS